MSAKRRQTNRPRLFDGAPVPCDSKPPEEFTGEGDETISGEGGGILYFRDGHLVRSIMAQMFQQLTPDVIARSLRAKGKVGVPLNKVNLDELISVFTGALVRAAYEGDAETFRKVAEALNNPLHQPDPSDTEAMIFDAVHKAARELHRVPTIQEIGRILYQIKGLEGTNHRFPTAKRADKVRELLSKIGFQWLPGNKRGEHLRRKSP